MTVCKIIVCLEDGKLRVKRKIAFNLNARQPEPALNIIGELVSVISRDAAHELVAQAEKLEAEK